MDLSACACTSHDLDPLKVDRAVHISELEEISPARRAIIVSAKRKFQLSPSALSRKIWYSTIQSKINKVLIIWFIRSLQDLSGFN